MKVQWKLVLGLLIGMLAIGQIVAVHQAVANHDEDLAVAQSETRDAAKASQQALNQLQTMNTEMQKMMSMSMTVNEKQMMKVVQAQGEVVQNLYTANIHSLNALNHIWAHVDRE